MSLLKDKNGQDINYGDRVELNGKKYALIQNKDIEMIKQMKYQGYLHLLQCEIELIDAYKDCIWK